MPITCLELYCCRFFIMSTFSLNTILLSTICHFRRKPYMVTPPIPNTAARHRFTIEGLARTAAGELCWRNRDPCLRHTRSRRAGGRRTSATCRSGAGHRARAVASQLALPRPIPCALAGSVILHAGAVMQSFQQAATAQGLALSPITPVPEPARGAVRLAPRSLTHKNS